MTGVLRVILLATWCVFLTWADQPARGSSATHPAEALSVCEALKRIEQLNGQMVTIRGVVAWIGRHGVSAIAQYGLDPYVQPCPGIHRRKRSWPPALHITSPQALESLEGTVAFQEQAPRLRDLANMLREREQATGKDAVIATIAGEIKTRKNIRIRRRGDDIIGNGYGQVGACPGVLVVKTVIAAEDPETHTPIKIRSAAD